MSNVEIGFKIRQKSDGLFSTGTSDPKFNSQGKVWWKKGGLTSHLNNFDYEKQAARGRECKNHGVLR